MREHEIRKRPLVWEEFDAFSSRCMKNRKKKKRKPAQSASLAWEDAEGKRISQSGMSRGLVAGRRTSSSAPLASQSPSDVAQLGRRPPPPPPLPPPSMPQTISVQSNVNEIPGLYEVPESSEVSSDSEDSSSSDEEETNRDREIAFRRTMERARARRRSLLSKKSEEEVSDALPPLVSWSEIDKEEGSESSDSDNDSDSVHSTSKVSDGPQFDVSTPPPVKKRVKSHGGPSTSTPKTPEKKPLRLFKERVSDVMRQLSGRQILASYGGSQHKEVILGLGPRSLYRERQWRVQFEDRKKESRCSALELTKWLLPPVGTDLPRGMCQFIGRRVQILKNQKILQGRVVRVLPPCKWLVNFEDGSKSTCSAQELLLWMRTRQDVTHTEVSPKIPPSPPKIRTTEDLEEEEVDTVSITDKLRAINSDNTSGDLDCCEVRKSTIPGAGLGLLQQK